MVFIIIGQLFYIILEHNNFLIKKTNARDVLQVEIRAITGAHGKISTFHIVGTYL